MAQENSRLGGQISDTAKRATLQESENGLENRENTHVQGRYSINCIATSSSAKRRNKTWHGNLVTLSLQVTTTAFRDHLEDNKLLLMVEVGTKIKPYLKSEVTSV